MRLPRDIISKTYKKPRVFLCEVDKTKICELDVTDLKGTFKFNGLSEISFEVGRVYNNMVTGDTIVNPYYNKIEALRLVYLEGFGYFELQGPELSSNGIKEAKACTAYSYEYTLSTKYLEEFYVNTGETGSIEVTYADDYNNGHIIPVTLYNPSNPQLSLLHLALAKDYGNWKIGYVDPQIATLSRQFEVDRESIYDFLVNEVCEKFNCYIVFDTINNEINVYAESLAAKFIGDGVTNTFIISPPFDKIGTVAVDGYKTTRWNYNTTTGALVLEDIPIAGANIEVIDGALSKWETDVYITFENLSQEININYNADDIKTVLTVTYGEDGDIREANLGLPYIVDLSYYCTPDWMGKELYDAYIAYQQKCNRYQVDYTNNSQEMLEVQKKIDFEEVRQSLQYAVADNVAYDTVGTYYTRGGTYPNYYYTEVSLPSEYNAETTYYKQDGINLTEDSAIDLYYAIEDCYLGNGVDEIRALITEDQKLFAFMDDAYSITKLADNLEKASSMADKDVEVKAFLDIMWKQVGRTPLKMQYLEPFKKIQISLIDGGYSVADNQSYPSYYLVTLFLDTIEAAISALDITIKEYTEECDALINSNAAISNELLMDKNFTKEQLIRLNAFLREDELQLDDIVETEQDTVADSFKIKQDAMESGRIELNKRCQPQLQFSMSMANIYALPEFEPIIHQFQLGKVVKVGLRPDYIKQSRLLQVSINFEDFSDFSCEFGELTSLRTQSDIHADLLSQAISAGKSVAQNASYWTKGSDEANSINARLKQGLLDTVDAIKSIDGTQDVYFDKYGLHLQKIDPTTGEKDPRQTWMVNNQIVFTDDNFKTSKAALGEFTVDGERFYGLLAQAVIAGYIEGTKIRGGTIQIGELGDDKWSFEVDEDGNVSMLGGAVKFSTTTNSLGEAIGEIEKNIPTKTSDLVNDSEYQNASGVVSIIDGTVDADYVNALAINVDAANINGKLTADQIDATNLTVDGANITGELTIGQLPDSVAKKEDLPTKTSQLTNDSGYQDETGIVKIVEGTITADYVNALELTVDAANITGELTVGQLPNTVAQKDDIPTDISQLNNDSGYQNESGVVTIVNGTVTADYVNALELKVKAANITDTLTIGQLPSTIAETSDIPTKLSQLDNDSGYQNASQVTTITKDTVTTSYVNALNVVAGSVAAENITGTTITGKTIFGGNLLIGDKGNTYAEITEDGVLNCNGANITGNITTDNILATGGTIGGCVIDKEKGLQVDAAHITGTLTASQIDVANLTVNNILVENTSGSTLLAAGNNSVTIGGWNVANNGLWKSTSDGQIRLIPNGDLSRDFTVNGFSTNNWVILCGADNGTTANFGVTKSGSLYASNANISGIINADNGGKIGDWEISDSCLYGHGGKNAIRLFPRGVLLGENTFYLVIYDSGGSVPIGGITASGWKNV